MRAPASAESYSEKRGADGSLDVNSETLSSVVMAKTTQQATASERHTTGQQGLKVSDDGLFYTPNPKRAPLSVGQPGEKLFEFLVGDRSFRFELRDQRRPRRRVPDLPR
jgi:hypothetical protein